MFCDLSWSGSAWSDGEDAGAPLTIRIHDSDIATVMFRPAPGADGLFHMGVEPGDYFEDPSIPTVDVPKEAGAFVIWAQDVLKQPLTVEQIEPLMARKGEDPEADFVEESVVELIELLGLPTPDELTDV